MPRSDVRCVWCGRIIPQAALHRRHTWRARIMEDAMATDHEIISEYRSYYAQATCRVYATDRDTVLELHWAARCAFELARELWRRGVEKRDRRLTCLAAKYMGNSMCLIYRADELGDDVCRHQGTDNEHEQRWRTCD